MSIITANQTGSVFSPASLAAFDSASTALRSFFARLHSFLSSSSAQRERDSEEAYLAEATDRYDLEFRMRELDRAQPQPYWMTGLRG